MRITKITVSLVLLFALAISPCSARVVTVKFIHHLYDSGAKTCRGVRVADGFAATNARELLGKKVVLPKELGKAIGWPTVKLADLTPASQVKHLVSRHRSYGRVVIIEVYFKANSDKQRRAASNFRQIAERKGKTYRVNIY